MVTLNDSASQILTLIDGESSAKDIIDALQQKFPDAYDLIAVDVEEFLTEALEKNWIRYDA